MTRGYQKFRRDRGEERDLRGALRSKLAGAGDVGFPPELALGSFPPGHADEVGLHLQRPRRASVKSFALQQFGNWIWVG